MPGAEPCGLLNEASPCFGSITYLQFQKKYKCAFCFHTEAAYSLRFCSGKLMRAGVRYVVDAGRAKAKLLEAGGALARYEVGWVSQAAAEQRAGRAGRMGPGHCYRYRFALTFAF